MIATKAQATFSQTLQTSDVGDNHVTAEPCPTPHDVISVFHYLDSTCIPERLNANQNLV